MHSEPPAPGRTPRRLAAAGLIGLMAAGAFAAPAHADIVTGVASASINPILPYSITPGEDPERALVQVEYTPTAGYEDVDHAVTVEIEFEGASGTLGIDPGDDCSASAGVRIYCTYPTAGPYWVFSFDLSADAPGEDTTYPYTVTASIDGVEFASETGTLLVIGEGEPDPHKPFLHGDAAPVTGAVPGSTVTVEPLFRQERDLDADAAAVVASISDPFSRVGISQEGASVVADYDNCAPQTEEDIFGGVECVFTGFTGQTGSAFTFSEPIQYAVDADALGPFEVCECVYSVRTVDAATLAEDYGHITWDPASEDLLGIEATDTWTDPADPEMAQWEGLISITTTANPFDLAVPSGDVEGSIGRTSQVTVPVTNNGPATVYNRSDDFGSASIRVELPVGTALDSIDSDGTDDWTCLDPESLADEYERTETVLDRYDLYCFLMTPLAAGETVDFTFTLDLTAGGFDLGYVEIVGLTTGVGGASLEADFIDNVGALQNMAEEAEELSNDYNGDGFQDLLAVRESDGSLLLYSGDAAGSLVSPRVVSTGWATYDVVMAGDLTGDGIADVLGRDKRTGTLYRCAGDGNGGLGAAVKVGSGWGAMGLFTALDYDGSGTVDILAVRDSDGAMLLYPGRGDGTFGAAQQARTGFNWIDGLTGVGDVDADGRDDFLVRIGQTQEYWLFASTSTTGAVMWDTWLGDGSQSRTYSQFTSVGDLDRDGLTDLVLVDSRSGALHLQGIGEHELGDHSTIGAGGWGAMRLAASSTDRATDYDQDGGNDLIGRNANGTTYLYFGDGTGAFAGSSSWGPTFSGMNLLETAGDFTGDGKLDLLARTTGGVLYVFPGTNTGDYEEPPIRIGGGWNAMSAIVSGSDFNNDGKTDIVARESATGNLWLYPGTATGSHGTRVLIGTGWNSMSLITAVGDLDHDGAADVIARKNSDNCMYFYAGKPAGGVKNGVKIGCGWNVMNAVASVGDFNGDGHADWVARHTNGSLYLYKGNGAGTYTSSSVVGSGWNGMDLLA
ncbi:hypothetical protein GCM10009830_46320 [Glycomyces endophyticus]|uniref:VCBS repeat-containing protein n=1 Tax=Glycomyces endophyticus TaxID=480996 RepID=A0ABN2HTG3_9ACTN